MKRVTYGIEVDYPAEKGWRSVEEHSTPEGAQSQWDALCREFPAKIKFPMRIIETTVEHTERVWRHPRQDHVWPCALFYASNWSADRQPRVDCSQPTRCREAS